MLRVSGLFLALCVSVGTGVEDYLSTDGSFTFMFHDLHDLLLTIYDGPDADGHAMAACYFSSIDGNLKDLMVGNNRRELETQIQRAILSLNSDRVRQTSLSEMRDIYQDRLADWHCQGKDVFELEIDYLQCLFDMGLCGWQQVSTDNMEWSLHAGPLSPVRRRRNPSDFKNSVGHYLRLKARNSSHQGNTAILASPALSLDKPMCLEFWYKYWVPRTDKSRLAVYIKNSSTEKARRLWEIRSDQGTAWHRQRLPISPLKNGGTWRIYFQADKGHHSSDVGEIAIDDLRVHTGFCKPASKLNSPKF